MRKFLLAAVAALALTAPALADSGAPVNQAANRNDMSTFLQGPAGGATSCAAVNTTAALNTVTITPPAGYYVVVTGFYLDITTDATGTTQVATMSTTNLTGSPVWSLASLAIATSASGSIRQIAETYPTGLRSAAPGTAVTFVPSAQNAHQIYCTRVAGYFMSVAP